MGNGWEDYWKKIHQGYKWIKYNGARILSEVNSLSTTTVSDFQRQKKTPALCALLEPNKKYVGKGFN